MSSACKSFLSVVAFLVFIITFGAAWTMADKCSRAKDCYGYRATYYETARGASEEVSQSAHTEELIASYTLWLAMFTGGLFVATSGLWIATFRLWKTTLVAVDDGERAIAAANKAVAAANRHADESAKAAVEMAKVAEAMDISAKAAIAANTINKESSVVLNRAYIYFHLISDTCSEFFGGVSDTIEFVWDVVNYGKTPGRILAVSGGTVLSAAAPLAIPSSPNRRFGKVILAEREFSDPYTCDLKGLTVMNRHNIMTRQTSIWFAGIVYYSDVFGNVHQTGWGFLYDVSRHELLTDHVPPAYNMQT